MFIIKNTIGECAWHSAGIERIKLANELGQKAALLRQRGRAGRTVKIHSASKQLHAAGTSQGTTGVFAYPKGFKV